jgi:hypothetical protein
LILLSKNTAFEGLSIQDLEEAFPPCRETFEKIPLNADFFNIVSSVSCIPSLVNFLKTYPLNHVMLVACFVVSTVLFVGFSDEKSELIPWMDAAVQILTNEFRLNLDDIIKVLISRDSELILKVPTEVKHKKFIVFFDLNYNRFA